MAEARSLIDRGAYFVVHAPGRTGKTTALRALAAELTAQGSYAALLCSAKIAGSAHADVVLAQDALLSAITIAAEQDLPEELRPPRFAPSSSMTRLWEGLSAWASVCRVPIVLFFDDVDSLDRITFENLIQQLETGFIRRPAHFPWAVGLVSRHDLRRNGSLEAKEFAVGGSTGPFEAFWSSRLLAPFTIEEVRALYAQHFGNLDEAFVPDAIDLVHKVTSGHPFFVQALGRELAKEAKSVVCLTTEHVAGAYWQLVAQQTSPIDDFAVRLAEPRVLHVVESLFLGTAAIASIPEADIQFVRDMGLLAPEDPVRIADTFHKALLSQVLTNPAMRMQVFDVPVPCGERGKIDVEAALRVFESFYTTHVAELVPAMVCTKVAEELVFLGFLRQLAEGRGFIDVTYGPGRCRMEVTMTVALEKADDEIDADAPTRQCEVFVLVARRKGDSGLKKRALKWLDMAMNEESNASGTLVIFDKRGKRSCRKNFKWRETVTEEGKTVRLLRI